MRNLIHLLVLVHLSLVKLNNMSKCNPNAKSIEEIKWRLRLRNYYYPVLIRSKQVILARYPLLIFRRWACLIKILSNYLQSMIIRGLLIKADRELLRRGNSFIERNRKITTNLSIKKLCLLAKILVGFMRITKILFIRNLWEHVSLQVLSIMQM